MTMFKYDNGTHEVTIYTEDGTKFRHYYDNIKNDHPLYPENIDLKITNKCDLNCPFCYENSHINGKHADLKFIKNALKGLPAGVEIAIGGGNPLMYPDLEKLLKWLKQQNLIANITINQTHLLDFKNAAKVLNYIGNGYIYGLGVSINDVTRELPINYNNMVIHVIAGVHSFNEIIKILRTYKKILILGYKDIGRGIKYHNKNVDRKLNVLKTNIWYLISNLSQEFKECVISFDNLAIEQLDLKNKLTKTAWETFYLGNDGKYSMFIDAVQEKYAKSSVDVRIDAKNKTAIEFFRII